MLFLLASKVLKMKNNLIIFLLLLIVQGKAQDNTLFTVNNEPISEKEFIRVYEKNLNLVKDKEQKDIDNYLELFINYKLKLQEAKALGYDKDKQYVSELTAYRKQLSKGYLTDTEASERLLEEAFKRMKYDVNVDHILIRLNSDASPKDTLAAYQKLDKLRKRLKKDDIKKLQKEFHDGENMFVEQLGYFSAFDMVYPFETTAYNTTIGKVSEPFRTSFGLHILKVNDKRDSQGERTLAHILISDKNQSAQQSPKVRIDELYEKLQNGESFESLARRFSDDKSSSRKNGLIGTFKRGRLSDKTFENQAFSIATQGSYTKPFKTQYGWHIVKLVEDHPVTSLDDMRHAINEKVLKDKRSQLIGDGLYNDLKSRYSFKEDNNALMHIQKMLNNSYFSGTWKAPQENSILSETLFSIRDKEFTYKSFTDYITRKQLRGTTPKPLDNLANDLLKNYRREKLYEYHEANLEEEFEDFAIIMQEYREGILLFNLMEKEIWSKSKTDTLAVKSYYETHKEDYKKQLSMTGLIASVTNKKAAKQVKRLLSQNMTIEEIKKSIKNNYNTSVIFDMGVFNKGSEKLPKAYKFKEGISEITKDDNYYVVTRTDQVHLPTIIPFEEIKGRVINDYQQVLEANWLKELKAKYPVTINNNVLLDIKKRYN